MKVYGILDRNGTDVVNGVICLKLKLAKISTVNLIYLEEQADKLVASGKASKDGDAIVIDVTELGYDKVLGKGKISKTFKISAPQFSASAIEKIEELGGEAILL